MNVPMRLEDLSDDGLERLHRSGLLSDDEIERVAQARLSPRELATLDAIAYGIAKLFHTPLGQLKAEADAHRAMRGGPRVGAVSVHDQLAHLNQLVALHETFWTALAQRNPTPATREFLRLYWDPWFTQWWTLRVYPDIAARVRDAAQGLSSLREIAAYNGIPTPDLGTSQHGIVRPEGFSVAGLKMSDAESGAYNDTPSGGYQMSPHADLDPTQVGHWFLPLALGVPAGAAGGYFYRKWQESHPGKLIPWISGETGVGGPWVDIVGAQAHRQATSLIQSAVNEVLDVQSTYPGAGAYVWSLEAPSSFGYRPGVVMGPITEIVPFATVEQALAHMRDRIHTEHVALALFDRRSPHWPNPVNWTKSDDPAHETTIAQQVAKFAPAHAAGEVVGTEPWQSIVGTEPWQSIVGTEPWQSIVGTEPWHSIVGTEPWHSIVGSGPWGTLIGAAVDVLRRQAQAAAEEMPGRVIGVVRDADNRWKLKSFRNADAADSWFGHVTHEPSRFTYAAYFDKSDVMFPHPLNEAIGAARAPAVPSSSIPRVVAEV